MSKDTNTAAQQRAISDIVGYVLIFAILLSSVGIVATLGLDQLQDVHVEQQTQNADRSLHLLADHVDEIQKSRAIERENDIKLDTGRLSTMAGSGPSSVTVHVNGTGESTTLDMDTLQYEGEDENIIYEGGAIVGETRTGHHVLRREPSFVCADDRAIVSVVSLQGPSDGLHYGGGTASVRVRENQSQLHFPINRTGPDSLDESTGVMVDLDSQFEDAWRTALLGSDSDWQDLPDPTKFECDATADVHVRQTVINVSIAR